MTERLTVVTSTAPTPNGPLHLGHLSGPFVAADVAARAARARGARTLTVSGLDPHQNYVQAKAAAEGRTAAAALDEYEALVRRALRAARITYDVFADPRADAGYRDAVARLLGEFAAHKAVVTERVILTRCGGCRRTLHHAYVSGTCPGCGAGSSGGTCEGCGAFTTAENLGGARCSRCGGAPEPFEAEVPLLRLEAYREVLTDTWSRAVMPARVRSLTGHYLTAGLPDVPLAYPTDWGIPAGADGLRIDVWAEMGLGLLAGIARRIDPAAGTLDEYGAAWARVGECWHFLGIDNAFYFGMLFPAMFAAAGLPPGWLGGLVVNEFYRLDGLKFSTSRSHAIWAHEFLAGEDPGTVRMFACWDRPDRYESGFTRQAYAQFRDWVGGVLDSGGTLPPGLAAAEARRAGHALEFGSFDPGLALRCLLAAGAGRAPEVLAAITGTAE
jgi:methionyl-tRNA synthetase